MPVSASPECGISPSPTDPEEVGRLRSRIARQVARPNTAHRAPNAGIQINGTVTLLIRSSGP
jgi:hypothetical protein